MPIPNRRIASAVFFTPKLLYIGAIVMLPLTKLRAQMSLDLSSPSNAVKSAFGALNERNWFQLVNTLDPVSLTEFKRSWQGMIGAHFEHGGGAKGLASIFGVASVADYAERAPAALAANFIEAKHPEAAVTYPTLRIIGEVGEGPGIVDVVYERVFKLLRGGETSFLSVVRTVKVEETWKLQPNSDVLGMPLPVTTGDP